MTRWPLKTSSEKRMFIYKGKYWQEQGLRLTYNCSGFEKNRAQKWGTWQSSISNALTHTRLNIQLHSTLNSIVSKSVVARQIDKLSQTIYYDSCYTINVPYIGYCTCTSTLRDGQCVVHGAYFDTNNPINLIVPFLHNKKLGFQISRAIWRLLYYYSLLQILVWSKLIHLCIDN